jgi:hypothetical protein
MKGFFFVKIRPLIPGKGGGGNQIWCLMPVKQDKGVRRESFEGNDARQGGKRS